MKALELFPTNDKLLSLLKDFQDEFEVNLQKDSKDDFEKEDSKQKSIEVVSPVGVETDEVLQTPGVLIESQGFLDDVDKSFDNWNKGKSFEKSLMPSFDLCITQEFEREETEKEDLHSVEIVEEVLGSDLDKVVNVTEDVLKKKVVIKRNTKPPAVHRSPFVSRITSLLSKITSEEEKVSNRLYALMGDPK